MGFAEHRPMVSVHRDPTDPQKFFQDTSRQQVFDDALKFVTLLVSHTLLNDSSIFIVKCRCVWYGRWSSDACRPFCGHWRSSDE